MKKLLFFIVIILFQGCGSEHLYEMLQPRLASFYKILNTTEKQLLKEKKTLEASQLFEKRLSGNKKLTEQLYQIKDNENILYFSTRQVFWFFSEKMSQKIAYLKKIKQ